MKPSHNLIHRIKERAEKSWKTGKYILAMLPFLLQTLNAQEAKALPGKQGTPQNITVKDTLPAKEILLDNTLYERPDNDPASVKEIEANEKYDALTDHFFIYMTEFLNKNIDDIDKINATRKDLNKDISSSNPVRIDGVKVARFAVTSFFAVENDNVVLKNYSTIINGEKLYENEATIKRITYDWEQALVFETDSKEYDYNIILHHNGNISVVQKDSKKEKPLKLEDEKDILKFEALLKEIFPPAYISYREKALQELENNNTPTSKTKKK